MNWATDLRPVEQQWKVNENYIQQVAQLRNTGPLVSIAWIAEAANAPVIWNPHTPPFGLERGIHFLCKWKWVKSPVPGDKSEWCIPRPYFSTHGTPFVKQLIIASVIHWLKDTVGSHEISRLIFEQPANSLQGSSMHNECQNIVIVEVISLILLDKLTR